jgi:hypothetical protein
MYVKVLLELAIIANRRFSSGVEEMERMGENV